MKISKQSWHYKFLKWFDMEPSTYNLTLRHYRWTFVLTVLYAFTSGWFIEGIRHLIGRTESEPVELVDEDKK